MSMISFSRLTLPLAVLLASASVASIASASTLPDRFYTDKLLTFTFDSNNLNSALPFNGRATLTFTLAVAEFPYFPGANGTAGYGYNLIYSSGMDLTEQYFPSPLQAPFHGQSPYNFSIYFYDRVSVGYLVQLSREGSFDFDNTAYSFDSQIFVPTPGNPSSGGYLNLGTFNSTAGGGSATLTITQLPAVPEPATWALLVGGVGLIGAAKRRRAAAACAATRRR